MSQKCLKNYLVFLKNVRGTSDFKPYYFLCFSFFKAILLRDRQGEDYCVGCVEVDVPQQQPRHQTSQSTNQGIYC